MSLPTNHFRNDRGIAALIAIMMVGMLTLIGLAALTTSDEEITIAGNELQEMRSFYAAEAGLEMATALMIQQYDSTGAPPSTMPTGTDSLNGCQISFVIADDGPATQQTLTSGSLSGLYALTKSFAVTSTGASQVENAQVTLGQAFEVALIPVFQFAVFYDHDLWMTPLYDMIIDGRVHVNGDMNLQAFTKVEFTSKVAAAGDINHGFPNGQYSTADGNIYFKDRTGLYQGMNKSGSWLDAGSPNWYDSASDRWDGNVQDDAFGQSELNLPLGNSDADPHKIIERAAGNTDSYENKATFKVIDGTAWAKVGGLWQDVTTSLPAGTVTSNTFYDAREKKTVNATDIDVAKLSTSTYSPANGVVYASDQRSGFNAARLINGSDINRPLSVYSENPVYVKGDYNTTDKQPAAIVADAVTFLSNSWSDANSTKSMSSRKASATKANVAVITGDTEPTQSNYGGGLENLPRFLEDWDARTFTYRGSLVALWRSVQSKGEWRYSGSDAYYTAPTRDWGFDQDLKDPNKLPPETPAVRVFFRTGWRQEYVGPIE